jgi:hypothetical protein
MVLATLVLGCSDGRLPTPITPTPTEAPSIPGPAPSGVLYNLSGVVFEVTSSGRTPVEGVEVYCDPCGPPLGHSARHTDANGLYSFDGAGGVTSGHIELILAKQGYKLLDKPDQSGPSGIGWMGTVGVTVTGDTRADIEIIKK